MNVYFIQIMQEGLRREIADWLFCMQNDKTGVVRKMWLEDEPWLDDKHDRTRLLRLNTDFVEPWLPVWREFSQNQTRESRSELSKQYPWLALWINMFDKDYSYDHYVDKLVHAAIHQNFPKFRMALLEEKGKRDLTDMLPAWAALSALGSALKNPDAADECPEVVNALLDFTRMLVNPGNNSERVRYKSLQSLLETTPELNEIREYAQANTSLTTPYNLASELRMAKFFPLSTFISAVEDRETTPEQVQAHVDRWPRAVYVAYDVAISLGDTETNAAIAAWSSHRHCFKTNTMETSDQSFVFS